MANYNKVILAGNLTRDPQLSYLPSNTPVVEFGMAINRRFKGQDGNQRDETCFVDLRAYGRPAETINQYMRKGRSILIEGRLQFHQWQGQDGAKRSKHMVVVDTFQFLDSAPRGEGGGNAPRRPEAVAGGGIEAPPPPSDDEVPPMRAESDIPF